MVCRAPSKPGVPGRSPTRKSKPEWQLTSCTCKQRSTTSNVASNARMGRMSKHLVAGPLHGGRLTDYSALLQSAATPVTGCSCSWGLIYGMNEMTSLCNYTFVT